jgi:serine/threonine protein kinase
LERARLGKYHSLHIVLQTNWYVLYDGLIQVAIKRLNKARIDQSGNGTQRALREIMVHKMLRHPHICHLMEVIDDTDNISLVLEHCAGGEFFDLIVRRGKLPESEARVYFNQLVDAVCYCHAKGVVHRGAFWYHSS